jgi:hypothetical protein
VLTRRRRPLPWLLPLALLLVAGWSLGAGAASRRAPRRPVAVRAVPATLVVRWRTPVGRAPLTAPALVGDEAWVADHDGRLTRLEAASGKRLGTGAVGAAVAEIVPLAGGGAAALTATGELRFLTALGEVDGTPLALGAAPAAGATATTELLLVPVAGGRLVAVDVPARTVRWTAELGEPVRAPVAAGGDRILAGGETQLLLLRPDDGEVLVRRPFEGPVETGPGYVDGLFLVGTPGHRLHGVDPASGKSRWRAEVGRGPTTDVVAVDDHGVLATHANQLIALKRNGTPVWRAALPARVLLPPRRRDRLVLVVPHRAGLVQGFDVETGDEAVRFDLADPFDWFTSPPAATPELLLLPTSRGELVAIGPPPPLPAARPSPSPGEVVEPAGPSAVPTPGGG